MLLLLLPALLPPAVGLGPLPASSPPPHHPLPLQRRSERSPPLPAAPPPPARFLPRQALHRAAAVARCPLHPLGRLGRPHQPAALAGLLHRCRRPRLLLPPRLHLRHHAPAAPRPQPSAPSTQLLLQPLQPRPEAPQGTLRPAAQAGAGRRHVMHSKAHTHAHTCGLSQGLCTLASRCIALHAPGCSREGCGLSLCLYTRRCTQWWCPTRPWSPC